MKVFLSQPGHFSRSAAANFEQIRQLASIARLQTSRNDVFVLPELIGADSTDSEYRRLISGLARDLGSWVVGGSHHRAVRGGLINSGLVADSRGNIAARYEKLWPYGIESELGVQSGRRVGRFEVAGCRFLVLLCADFWYSAVLLGRLSPRPDVILVPTFSISRRSSPQAARSLWSSMAVARAYEFSAYVGISDWAYPSEYHGLKSSSVAGLADPRPRNRREFFSRQDGLAISLHQIDIERLRELREHRIRHAFLHEEALTGNFFQPRRAKNAGDRKTLRRGKTESD